MVGVLAETKRGQHLTSNNPMIKYMLKQREIYARQQKHDYSHVFRKRTRFEMFRLSAIVIAIEFAYAAETSFVSPILLKIGIDHKHMTMAWGLSPIIGFFVSPILGSISDRCHLKWGRRRPIITILSFGILIGLILVAYGQNIGVLLGDSNNDISNNNITAIAIQNNITIKEKEEDQIAALKTHDRQLPNASTDMTKISQHKFAIILTILGMVLLDFDADTCQIPARTYLLDMCIPEDQPKALTTFTLFAGLGGTIGYALGGINWETTHIGSLLGGNIPTVFILVAIIFFICYIITVTTFREIPLQLIESHELLKPLSNAAVKKEILKNKSNIFYIQENNSLETQIIGGNEKYTKIYPPTYQNGHASSSVEVTVTATKNNFSTKAIDIEDDKPIENSVTLAHYLKSIFIMPHSMKLLALTHLLCWMGHVTYCLYFTDFVGEAVFHGDPMASHNSDGAILYEAGVRFGCWGMSIYAFSCSLYSLSVTKLMLWLGAKVVYISGILYYAVGMLILAIWPTKWAVLVFSTSAGVLYGTIFTMPYILIASYHSKNCFRVHNGEAVPLKQTRGLGTDVAIVSSMVFVAQFIISLCMGPLVAWFQSTCAVLYTSSFLAFFAAISAMFILYV